MSGQVRDSLPFAMVPEWLLRSEVSANAVRLYGVLHRHAGRGGAHPGRQRLCDWMRCSPATVDRALRELVDVGAVEVVARFEDDGRQTSNFYVLHPESGVRREGLTGDEGEVLTGDDHPLITGDDQTRAHRNESKRNEIEGGGLADEEGVEVSIRERRDMLVMALPNRYQDGPTRDEALLLAQDVTDTMALAEAIATVRRLSPPKLPFPGTVRQYVNKRFLRYEQPTGPAASAGSEWPELPLFE